MNGVELLEKVALDMVVHQYTKLGRSVDWCKDLFETNYRNAKTEYIELAKIALITLKSEPLSDDCIWEGLAKEEISDYKAMSFIKGIKFAEKHHNIGEILK